MKYLVAGLYLLIANPSYASGISKSHTVNAMIVVIVYLLFCGWIIWRYKKRTAQNSLENPQVNTDTNLRDENSILVAYASQTGNAEQLAKKTAESLKTSGLTVEIHSLSAIDNAVLQNFSRVLFVVSTTGEGDAPDNASEFLGKVMLNGASFPKLKYAILALGDATYVHYCGFGRTLEAWLQHTHAMPLFDMVEIDRHDDGALRHWQYQLGVLANDTEMADWKTPEYQQWKLHSRTLLNKGSLGAPVYQLSLSSQTKNMRWQAGDIAEVGPRNSPESVEIFLNRLGLDGTVMVNPHHVTFAQALLDKLLPHDELDFQDSGTNLAKMDAEAILLTLKT
ncbi:MAG: flavodoxin domain-containing protein, partial [Pseudomonadota bacterium]